MTRPKPVYIVPRPKDSCGCLVLSFVMVVLALTAILSLFGIH